MQEARTVALHACEWPRRMRRQLTPHEVCSPLASNFGDSRQTMMSATPVKTAPLTKLQHRQSAAWGCEKYARRLEERSRPGQIFSLSLQR